jgi:cation diffusion facilitator CzcD-associated flavoprotein CzcO
MAVEHFDVVIVGAGLSGIDAAHHLQALCPQRSYVILEQRERIGGTWDLFRYPGIRSDSDMLTMGYSFRPGRARRRSRRARTSASTSPRRPATQASTAGSASATRSRARHGRPRRRGSKTTRSCLTARRASG